MKIEKRNVISFLIFIMIMMLIISCKTKTNVDNSSKKDTDSLKTNPLTEAKLLFIKTDSVKKLNKTFKLDDKFRTVLSELEKQHPLHFFEKSAIYFKICKYDESAFLYHLGVLRYNYFNLTNKDYQASGDGALFESLKYETGENVSIYLKNYIDKFIEILKLVDEYVKTNDYSFHSKTINLKQYNELEYSKLINNLQKNKAKFIDEWTNERNKMLDTINKGIEEYNKLTDEEKKKLKE